MRSARPLQVIIGAALLAAVLSGRAGLFVRPWFVPLVVATGLVLLAATLRSERPHRLTASTAGLLLLPVLAGAAMTPELAGQAPAWGPSDGSAITSRIGDDGNPLLGGEGGAVTILQVVLADRELGAAALDGRPVELEAMVEGEGGLTRQVMVCCAADARPVGLATRGALPSTGTWVRATGTLTADGDRLVLEIEDVTSIPTPKDPLL